MLDTNCSFGLFLAILGLIDAAAWRTVDTFFFFLEAFLVVEEPPI